MLEVRNLTVTYPGSERPVLDHVDLDFPIGTTAVVGPSGSGKSTLFSALLGMVKVRSGRLFLEGKELPEKRSQRFSVVHQDYRLVPFLTVLENIRLSCELHNVDVSGSRLDTLLSMVGLQDFEDRRIQTLSGGEKQRVAISRALASSPSVLLADEPTGALDRKNSDNVSHLLREISKTSRIPVVLATHDEKVASVADQLIRLVGDGFAVVEKDLPA